MPSDLGQKGVRDRTRPVGPIARLAGFRWVERCDDHAVLRVPRWVPRSVIAEALRRIEADCRILYGQDARITHGRRLVRFDWPQATKLRSVDRGW